MNEERTVLILESEYQKLRKDAERLDKLDKHRLDDVEVDKWGDMVLVSHYWQLRCQCNNIRDAIDSGDIDG